MVSGLLFGCSVYSSTARCSAITYYYSSGNYARDLFSKGAARNAASGQSSRSDEHHTVAGVTLNSDQSLKLVCSRQSAACQKSVGCSR